jgi:PAS domain S-box-containing protein
MKSPLRVLYVEDSPDDAELLASRLAEEGLVCDVVRVDSRESLVAALQSSAFDLILTDYTLPKLDGFAALEIAKERHSDVPVVFVSGTIGEEIAIEAMKRGATDYVLKHRMARLASVVRRALSEREERAQRKEAEQALSDTTGHLQTLIREAPLAIIELDEAGNVRSWNEAATQLFGWTEQEVLGRELPYVPLGLEEESDRVWRAAMRGESPRSLELRRRRKNGSLVEVSLWATTLRDQTGRVTGSIGFLTDITESKRMEAALKESVERFDLAVRGSNEGLWDVKHVPDLPPFSPEYPIWYSPRFKELLGYEDHEFPNVLGNWMELLHPEDKDRILAALAAHLERNVPYDVEYRLLVKSGGYRWFRARGQAIRDEAGIPIRMAGSLQDVTGWKQLEEQLRQAAKMEAIGRLAGGVAHDFNNLLTAITGYSQMLLRRLGPEGRLRTYAEQIKKAGDRAEKLTTRLLAFSRRQVIQQRVVQLNDVVAGLAEMLGRLIGENVKLTTNLGPSLRCIKADPGQIEQVIVNLVVNARDAMPAGGTLGIETSNVEGDCWVRLVVRDSGVGMDAETRAHMFEPFFTTKETGTGLGLATVYGIVTQAGGTISVASEPGCGSTFTVEFPAVEDRRIVSEPGRTGQTPAHGSETVLLVEDEDLVRSMARESLENSGYQVLEAIEGEEALRHCDRHQGPIHLLLTDLVVPGMSGREIAKQVLARRPEARVLYMSGYAEGVAGRQGDVELGSALLKKPFTEETLTAKVREVLDAFRAT